MKLNKIMLAAVLAFGASSLAHAADQGHGKVTFTGSIIDAPCSIAPESVDQTVDLGQVSSIALKDGGKSVPRQFDIKLEQCDTTTLKTVTTTFDGKSSPANPELLGIIGTASGASIALTDMASNPIKLGTATPPQTLNDGNNTLRFAAYLQGDGASAAVVPGDFTAVADFKLAYQ
ncbi:Fimbria A protein precursor [Serratia entomophila]|uniref:fimbrial protein n=1 Tax=Serratia entomophila TaxID=42906 RepID=UPI001F24282C|nr:fimbrial protein [Serratia entomophila]UIW16820.1 type 1 fimbrial protein [Serratia entomophila]CAI0720414.1 Fimbria A protein precursor [Serratia entomophila]CAI0721563.1 Fimbria A protein precursor [Serratia entomophila]CAI0721582.1 Fimbria A protein precursor [Serratia entomophila]CAI0731738.1 Fimbria A protein precursor [Serratia entomophila]